MRIAAPHSLADASRGLENETLGLMNHTQALFPATLALSSATLALLSATRASTKRTHASTIQTGRIDHLNGRHKFGTTTSSPQTVFPTYCDGHIATCTARSVRCYAGTAMRTRTSRWLTETSASRTHSSTVATHNASLTTALPDANRPATRISTTHKVIVPNDAFDIRDEA